MSDDYERPREEQDLYTALMLVLQGFGLWEGDAHAVAASAADMAAWLTREEAGSATWLVQQRSGEGVES